jgi:membrane-bound inhibitor of C-type lysozyme
MRTPLRPLAGPLALVLLAGCSKPPPSPQENVAAAEGPHRYAYVCEDGRILSIGYPDRSTADVRVGNDSHRMKVAISGSGARYVGDGLQWWSKGDEGFLARLAPGEEIASDVGVRCVPPAKAPVSPPEPGTPGGLPDDRTPLSEAPAQPGSAQAAATVVETYYALIEAKKSADAAKLRSDGAAPDLSPYATYHAQVGAPGRVEGAAGSLYVEVPVVLYGRLTDGSEFHRSGRVTLRRVNNVPGATPEQLKWRIAKLDFPD